MTSKNQLPPIPPALADVALIDAPTCASSSSMSLSAWYDLVRIKEAPQPVIRRPRCTRWRLADLREWLLARADTSEAETVIAKAKKASTEAARKRAGARA